jgi:hypothetical protein
MFDAYVVRYLTYLLKKKEGQLTDSNTNERRIYYFFCHRSTSAL